MDLMRKVRPRWSKNAWRLDRRKPLMPSRARSAWASLQAGDFGPLARRAISSL